jgi:hypothetical protein
MLKEAAPKTALSLDSKTRMIFDDAKKALPELVTEGKAL